MAQHAGAHQHGAMPVAEGMPADMAAWAWGAAAWASCQAAPSSTPRGSPPARGHQQPRQEDQLLQTRAAAAKGEPSYAPSQARTTAPANAVPSKALAGPPSCGSRWGGPSRHKWLQTGISAANVMAITSTAMSWLQCPRTCAEQCHDCWYLPVTPRGFPWGGTPTSPEQASGLITNHISVMPDSPEQAIGLIAIYSAMPTQPPHTATRGYYYAYE